MADGDARAAAGGTGGRRQALHIAVSDACNNSCVFCLNARVDGRIAGETPRPPTLEALRATLEQGHAQGLRELAITIAEPTLGRHLVDTVRHARALGFEHVAMNTNGRRLGKGRLLADLLDAGLDRIILSIHGDRAELHDPVVGRPGAFDEVVEGLGKLRVLRPASGFHLNFLCVVTRLNLPHLEAIHRFFLRWARPAQGDGLSFTCMKMLGSAVGVFDDLGVRYGEIADAFLATWRRLGCPPEMMLSELPGCVLVARAASGPIPPIDVPDARHVREAGEADVRNTQLTERNYAKREACAACLLGPVCHGPLAAYVERFGWDEFPPVQALPAAVAAPAARPAPVEAGARAAADVAAFLFGTSTEGLARAGLHPVAFRRVDDGLALELRVPGDAALTVVVGPRDDATPAYVRTRHLNLSCNGAAAGDLVPRLVARLVRRLGEARFEEVREAWDRLTAGSPSGGPLPAGPAAAADEPEVPLSDVFGDTACGMMGAIDVLSEVTAEMAVLVHGDRGCMPVPEGSTLGIYSSDMREVDVVYGGERRLREAIADVLGRRKATTLLVLVSTCLSEMIGDDLDEVARAAEEEHGLPIVAVKATGLQPLRPVEVARRVHGALAARFLSGTSEVRDEVALVGYPDEQQSFRRELAAVLQAAGIPLGGVWPWGGLEALQRVAAARLVLAPERVVYRDVLARIDLLGGREVAIVPTPFSLAGCLALYGTVGARFDRAAAIEAAIAPHAAAAAARIARFRERHAGRRVAVSFGNNRKGTAAHTTVHLGVGYVPLLVELGLDPLLVALTEESAARLERVRALGRTLGTSGEAYVHRLPEGLTPILEQARVDVATNESCQKHFIDAARVPYLHFGRFEPGFGGIARSIDALEGALS